MCDLENESQSAPKDIFKVTHARSQAGVIVKEVSVSMH